MAIQLGPNEFFTPEQQDMMFRRGVEGIDVSNGFQQRGIDPKDMEQLRVMGNVYDMVQRGDLVPRQNLERPVQTQPAYQQNQVQQPVVQNAPVQVQNELPVSNNVQEDDLMRQLFPDQYKAPEAPVAQVQQSAPQQNVTQSEQPKINWEEVIYEQQNVLRSEAAKNGIESEHIMEWMGQLTPADYVELFKQVVGNAQSQQVQQAPAIQWQNQNYQQMPPSIGDVPSANIGAVKRDPQWSAFGVDQFGRKIN